MDMDRKKIHITFDLSGDSIVYTNKHKPSMNPKWH
jgi:hypothetical protein